MLIDGRQLTAESHLRADICVIGGGAAGVALARALSGTDHQVVLLESGGVNPDADTQGLYEGEIVGEPLLRNTVPKTLSDARLRFLGGSTNHWAGWCRPFREVDLESRPDLDQPGWPLSRDELDPWYTEAQALCGLGPFDYSPASWQQQHDLAPPIPDTDRLTTELFQIRYPMSFGRAYSEELQAASNVRVVLWANVTELLTDEAGTQVSTATLATLDHPIGDIEARVFVLATGGLEVPRLLLASRQRFASGLANDHDLVGRNFAEHLHLPAGYLVSNRSPEDLRFYAQNPLPIDTTDDEFKVMGILSPSQEAMRDEGLLGVEVELQTEPFPAAAPDQASGAAAAQSAAVLEAVENHPVGTVTLLAAVAQQRLNPDSRVLLTDELDPLGVPRIALDWRYTADDRTNLLRGLQLVADEVAAMGIGRTQLLPGAVIPIAENALGGAPVTQWLSVDPSRIDEDNFALGVGFHHMCTTRMDASPRRGVVDTDCRVHGVNNLYIAGSAVFPTPGVVTPTLTIVALALRLADHLDREVG